MGRLWISTYSKELFGLFSPLCYSRTALEVKKTRRNVVGKLSPNFGIPTQMNHVYWEFKISQSKGEFIVNYAVHYQSRLVLLFLTQKINSQRNREAICLLFGALIRIGNVTVVYNIHFYVFHSSLISHYFWGAANNFKLLELISICFFMLKNSIKIFHNKQNPRRSASIIILNK